MTGLMDEVVEAARRAERVSGVAAATLLAVATVETNGVAYAAFEGRREPLIRFEGHYFDRLLRAKDRAEARKLGIANPMAGSVRNPAAQSARWRLLDRAVSIDRAAACASTSWGLGQVMGAHWKALGFDSPEALADEARRSVDGQFSIVARFLKVEEIDRLLPRGAFAAFARRYNGPGYARNRYDAKIEAAYLAATASLGAMREDPGPVARRPIALEPGALGPGARGERVTALQRDLARHGLAVVADGIFGAVTGRAVSAFRVSKALAAGPFADAETLSLLSGEAAEPKATVSKGWLTPSVMLSTPLSWLSNLPRSVRTPMRSSSTSTERSSASPTIPPPFASPPPPSGG